MQSENWTSVFCQFKPNLDCKYTFSIDLAPDGIPFSAILSRKVLLQSKFGFILDIKEEIPCNI